MEKSSQDTIPVEVAYALPHHQEIIQLQVERGTTAKQAILRSGILQRFAGLQLTPETKVGIFSKPCSPDTPLREHDRVEIYRPLLADPKEVRKRRAAAGKKMRKEGDRSKE